MPITTYTATPNDAQGINRTFPDMKEESFPVHNEYFGSAKFVVKPMQDEIYGLLKNAPPVDYSRTFTCGTNDAVGSPVRISANNTVTTADASDASRSQVIGFILSKPTTTTCLLTHSLYYSGASGFSGFSGTAGSNQAIGYGQPVYLTNTSGYSGSPGTANKVLGESISPREAILRADPVTAMVPNTTGTFKNKLINGAFDVWQRGTAAVNTGVTGKPDRADRYVTFNDSNATVTHQQASPSLLTHAIAGTKVQYCSQLTVSAADTNLTGDQRFLMYQIMEGYNARSLAYSGFTFSFWMYGNQGTYSAFAGDNTYYNVQHFVLPNNTWTKIKITFPPNPNYAGSTTNGVGLIVGITLAMATGSTYATANLGNWQNAGKLGSTTQTNGLATNTNIFYTTLWQVEEGPIATKFEERDIMTETQLCYRYTYVMNGSDGYYPSAGMGYKATTGILEQWFYFPVRMRSNATATNNVSAFVATSPSGTQVAFNRGDTYYSNSAGSPSWSFSSSNPIIGYMDLFTTTWSGTSQHPGYFLIGPSVLIVWSAEF